MALQNFERRQFQSFGPNFRIDSGNPNVGFNGSSVYDLYGNTDSGDVSLMGMCQGGIYHFYNDRTIEIIDGQNTNNIEFDISSLIKSRFIRIRYINTVQNNACQFIEMSFFGYGSFPID